MSNLRRNVIYNVVLSISQVLFPLLVFPYVSRILGPTGIGSLAFVDGITQWCILLAALGIPVYGVREIAKVKNNVAARHVLFNELITVHLISTVVILILYIASFHFLSRLSSYTELFWIGAAILFVSVTSIEWFFQGMEEFPYITRRTIAVRALTIIAVYMFIKDSQDTGRYYLITLVGVSLNAILSIRQAKRHVSFSWRPLNLKRHIRPMLFIFSFAIVTSVYTQLDSIMLGFLTDDEQVGYYTTAVRVVKLITTVLVAISVVMVPALSFTINNGKQADAIALLRKSFALTVFVSVPSVVGLLITANYIITLYAGDEFVPAATALYVLAPTILIVGLNNVFGMQVLNPTHNEHLFFRAAVFGMFVSVGFNLLLIPAFSYIGAAITGLSTELIVCIALTRYAVLNFPFRPDWLLLAKALIATLPMLVWWQVIEQLQLAPSFTLICTIIGAIISYLIVQNYLWKSPLVEAILRLFSFKINR